MDFVNTVNQILIDIQNSFLNGVNDYQYYAKIIAGVGATVYAFFTFYKIVMGDGEEWKQFAVKLLAVYLGIIFYGHLISFINLPLDIITKSSKHIVETSDNNTQNFFTDFHETNQTFQGVEEYDEEIQAMASEYENESGSIIGNMFGNPVSAVGNFIESTTKSIRGYFVEAIYEIIKFLGMAAILILNLVRTFFLIVLQIFGIFAIALSIYPLLGNSFTQWLQKYINVYLWLPIGYILQGVINRLFSQIDLVTAATPYGITPETTIDSYLNNGAIAVIGLCSIVGFATVPTMSSWLVNAATNSLSSKLKGKTAGGVKQGVGQLKNQAAKGAKAVATKGTSIATDKAKNVIK